MPNSSFDTSVPKDRKQVHVVELDTETSTSEPRSYAQWTRALRHGLWIDCVGLVVLGIAIVASLPFWKGWFARQDQVVFLYVCAGGLLINFCRSNFGLAGGGLKKVFGLTLIALALMAAIVGMIPQFSIAGAVAVGTVVAGWAVLRQSAEPISHGLGVGLVALSPVLVDTANYTGLWSLFEPLVTQATSDISDFMVIPHVREGNTIAYGYGTAEYFHVTGTWDGLISLVAVSILYTLVFRRKLICASLSLISSVLIWIASRSVSWTILVSQSMSSGDWMDWNTTTSVITFAVAAVILLSLDQWFAAIFSPIPFEYISTDFPLFAIVWNWLCGLPEIMTHVPMRDSGFVPFDVDIGRSE